MSIKGDLESGECVVEPVPPHSDRIKKAMEIAFSYAQIDGAHHKNWCIDQMVRALTGCPMVEKKAIAGNGTPYTYRTQGESKEYRTFIEQYTDGDQYEWDVGIAP